MRFDSFFSLFSFSLSLCLSLSCSRCSTTFCTCLRTQKETLIRWVWKVPRPCPPAEQNWRMKSFVFASWLNLKRAARAAYYGASSAVPVCVCVSCLCKCACIWAAYACVCVCVHKANIYTQWNIIKTLKIYHIMRDSYRMPLQACRKCLCLFLSLALQLSLLLSMGHSLLYRPPTSCQFPNSPPAPASLVLSIPLSSYTCPSKRNSWSFPATQVSVRVCTHSPVWQLDRQTDRRTDEQQPAIVWMIDMSLP